MENSPQIANKIRAVQKSEITEHFIYRKLSATVKDAANREVLLRISNDERKHYQLCQDYTRRAEKPNRLKVWGYYLVSRVFGLTFGIKLMERGEGRAQTVYREIAEVMPQALQIAEDEDEHERQLIRMINEERLNYVGSMIRGLNDALVELTGALAGFTLALQNPRLIATVGLITGIAASLSMGATEYLARKSEESGQAPLKSALYTGTAYVFTVLFLIFPYLLLANVYLSLALMLLNAIIIITVFNFYLSVAKELSFWKNFSEMALLSLGVAAVSFGIGFIVRQFLGVEA